MNWRCHLSRWFCIGQWFKDGPDNCHRCGVWPSDVDYWMRRVRPFRAECSDRAMCDDEIESHHQPTGGDDE